MAALLEEKFKRSARRDLRAFTRYTFGRYEENWHHATIADWVEKLDRREIIPGFPNGLDSLIITAPPRHTKSELATVRRPALSLGRDPRRMFMVGTYNGDLAKTFSRGVRDVIRSDSYQRLFPSKFVVDSDKKWQIARPAKDENHKPSMIAAGITGGGFTGEGATDFIIDDPFKNQQEAWSKGNRDTVHNEYRTVAVTRLQPGGSICLQQTRWHDDDLAGRLIKAAIADKENRQWVVIALAATNRDGKQSYVWNTATGEKTYFAPYDALWPKWFPAKKLRQIEIELGPVFWQAMYQQAPTTAQGSIFKRDAWGAFDHVPHFERLIQVYDTAFEEGQENDYSASIDLGTLGNQFYVPDAWRGQVSFPDLVAKVYERWNACLSRYGRFPERILIENKGSGISLRQQIEANNLAGSWIQPDGKQVSVPFIPVVPMPARESKEVRAHGISGYQNAGSILLPRVAEWLSDYVDEHAAFPKGANDDQVDCTVHGVTYMTRPIEDEEHVQVFGEDVTISSDLDEFEMRSSLYLE